MFDSRQEAAAILALVVFTFAGVLAAPSRNGIFLVLFVLGVIFIVAMRDRDD